MKYINLITNNDMFRILLIFISLDVVFGVLRAIREHKINSSIGIDGIIRKVGMIIAICVSICIDSIVGIDLIAFIPTEIKEFIHVDKVGISFLFNSLYIVFESLSILKNMYKCKMPIPKKVQKYLEKILKEFTEEIKEGK